MHVLRRRAHQGLGHRLVEAADRSRFGARDVYDVRLEAELRLVEERRLGAWFLDVVEHVASLRSRGTPWHPGWGAAPSSLLLWALGATDIDPVRHGLLFERFVGPRPDRVPYVSFIVPTSVPIPRGLAKTWEGEPDGEPDEDAFEELVATLSLQRPSSEEAGLGAEYARRNKGSHRAVLPALDRVTARTRGLLLYDEQIIEAIARTTGWSLLEADAARREFVRPGPGLPGLREKFLSDAATFGDGPEGIGLLLDTLASAARTAIQKSHHVALATVACMSARVGRDDPNGSMSVP